MYRNNPYMTIHDSLVNIKKKWPDTNPPNPFPVGFDIFNSITVNGTAVTTYGLNINNLWSIFNQWFARLAIAKKVPRIGYEYVWDGHVYTVADVGDQAVYVWRCLDDMVGWYCNANRNRWEHIILADVAKYDPITNYNMEEYSGSSSKSGQITSTPSGATVTSKVAPFDGSNQDLQQTTTTPTAGTSGYSSGETGKVQFPYSDGQDKNPWKEEIITPEGNATSIAHLKRKGNIGVTTSQQMIQSEYDLRKLNVLQEFMNDVAKYSLILDWDSALNDQY